MPITKKKRELYPKNWKEISLRVRQRSGGVCEFCQDAVNGQPHPITGSRVVLTVAHLDHDPTNTNEDDMAAMCQKCHNVYDGPHRRANAAKTRLQKKMQSDLNGTEKNRLADNTPKNRSINRSTTV